MRGAGEKRAGWGGYSKGPLWVLALVALIDQIDTSILRGVLPVLEDEFGWSDLQLGALGFAFVFVNSIATIPAGWVADRYRRTRIIGWTLLSWSALSGLSAAAVNYATLFAARASLGIGQAVDDPSSTSLLADYYPARLRGRVFSAQQVSVFLGGGIGIALGGFVGQELGWRWAFALVGMPGSLIAFLVFRLREPRRGEADVPAGAALADEARDAEPRADVTDGEPGAALSAGAYVREAYRSLVAEMRMIFGIRTMRFVLVGVGTLLFTVSGVGYWLATYHERYSGMSQSEAAGVTGLVLAVSGIIGTIWGGRTADAVYGTSPAGRIKMTATAILACAGLFLVSLAVPLVALRLVLQFLGVLAIASAFPALRASMMDVVPAESRGVSASAFALVSTVFGTALAPPLVGLISDLTGSLVAAFYIVTPPILVGTLILYRAKDTIVEDAEAIIRSMMERSAEVETAAGPNEPPVPMEVPAAGDSDTVPRP